MQYAFSVTYIILFVKVIFLLFIYVILQNLRSSKWYQECCLTYKQSNTSLYAVLQQTDGSYLIKICLFVVVFHIFDGFITFSHYDCLNCLDKFLSEDVSVQLKK